MPSLSSRDDVLSHLSRSTCIFPSLSSGTTFLDKGSVKASLRHDDACRIVGDDADANLISALQVAWALTLQCFVVADVLCFESNAPCVGDKSTDARRRDNRKELCLIKFDRNEPLQSLLGKIRSRQYQPASSGHVAGSEISWAQPGSSEHQYNTALFIRSPSETHGASKGSPSKETVLAIIVTPSLEQDMIIEVEHLPSHVSGDIATSVLGTFQHIFLQIMNATDKVLIEDIEICPPSDRTRIQELNRKVTPTRQRCLHDLIIEQCKKRPKQLAIRSWDGDMTYETLDDLSGRLASHLVALGVRPETFVLSCFEKSTWAIVARLAILRAGGAYISIHASNPPAYLQSVIDRTRTTILVTDSHFVSLFRDTVPTLVELSSEWLQKLPATSNSPICENVKPDNACLVLFTSGSTGTPKGIIQMHSSYATAIQDYASNLQLGPHTRFFQFDDYAFDISNLEFLVPLILGGTCCVPKYMNTVEDLASQIRDLDANIIFLTPTVAIRLEPTDVPCLETMCVGGEPLPKDLVRKWAAHNTHLVNQYGMGEVAICCAYNDRVDPYEGSKIGRPSSGAIWLVDPASPERLVPIGAVGELIIEGPHLSRGYIDSTALQRTEAGFLKHVPRWTTDLDPGRPSFRMYRSGDLGRMNTDGTITYLGRKDTILKIDGCRVDALEVEHQARKFLSDKDTIVVDLLGTINGQADPSLTAFLYLNDHPLSASAIPNGIPALYDILEDEGMRLKIEEIKQGIGLALPRYMIPTTFVLMTWTPRTASKKIDRKKIRALGQAFYLGILEEKTKDVDYAHRMKVLPM